MGIARGPEIFTTPMPPAPAGVAIAAMVSLSIFRRLHRFATSPSLAQGAGKSSHVISPCAFGLRLIPQGSRALYLELLTLRSARSLCPVLLILCARGYLFSRIGQKNAGSLLHQNVEKGDHLCCCFLCGNITSFLNSPPPLLCVLTKVSSLSAMCTILRS